MKKYLLTFLFALVLAVPAGQAHATVYYIDQDCASHGNCGNGTATTSAFSGLENFTEVARTAGDIAFVRRGTASTTSVVSDLDFTSDGTDQAPLILMADYDNLWGDFSTSTQTYSVAVGTSTLYASATITDVSAGQWIYVAGDCFETYNSTSFNDCKYAYEVAGVSGNALTLYFPYAGDQAGSGLDLRIMPAAPIWNTTGQNFQLQLTTDNYWVIKGLDIRSSNGTLTFGGVALGESFSDMIFQSGSAFIADSGGTFMSSIFYKTRVQATGVWVSTGSGAESGYLKFRDTYAVYSQFVSSPSGADNIQWIFDNAYMFPTSASVWADCWLTTNNVCGFITGRNMQIKFGGTDFIDTNADDSYFYFKFEDWQGIPGQNRWFSYKSDHSTVDTYQFMSTTSASYLRSGGGPVSQEVVPIAALDAIGPESIIASYELLEYPIYATAGSKTVTMYAMSPATSNWTANPTNKDFYILCDYWANDTGATSTRKTARSTETMNFTGSTSWQSLSVTCAPKQDGLMYIRAYYRKTKEAAKSNVFYIDNTPVIN